MPRVRRCTGLALALAAGAAAGCASRSPTPEADPAPQAATAVGPIDTVGIVPDPAGGLVRGGKGEPPPPPPPKPGEMLLPPDGGVWPWPVGAAPAPRPARPVTFPDVKPPVAALAVRPEADRAVVAVRLPGKAPGEPDRTLLLWCDTAAGAVLAEWEVKDLWHPLGLSPDGRRFLVRRDDPAARSALGVWTVTPENTIQRRTFQPHDPPGESPDAISIPDPSRGGADTSRDVAWAAWVGPDRIVSSSAPGQLRVFNANTFQKLGSIDAAPGRPAVTPDGSRVGFLVGNGVALLDPAGCRVVSTRRTGRPPEPAALAFSPDGKAVAVGGLDRAVFLDLDGGSVWETPYPHEARSSREVPEAFGWAGPRHLFLDHYLYDPTTPEAVWDYGNVGPARPAGRQTWVVVTAPQEPPALRAFELPHPGVAGRLAAEAADPGLFLLRAGDGVRVDVSQLPEEKRAGVAEDIGRRLREVGYKPDPRAAAAAVASLDPPAPAAASFPGHRPVAYTRAPARLKLVKDGAVLWEQAWAADPPALVSHPKGTTLAQHVQDAGYGRPDYRIYTAARIPPQFRGPAAARTPPGRSDLFPTGAEDR